MRAAWFCPGCQRYHAPHCDTCPQPALQYGLPNTLPNIPVWTPWQQPSTGDPNRWKVGAISISPNVGQVSMTTGFATRPGPDN